MKNYPIKGIAAEYFVGDSADQFNMHKTVPKILRQVADWMDANKIDDVAFVNLTTACNFVDDDDYQMSVTVYYRREDGEEK